MTFIGFHNPNEENGYLSNWYLSKFTVEGKELAWLFADAGEKKAIDVKCWNR